MLSAMSSSELTPAGATHDTEADAPVPHVAFPTVRSRPPSKVFATKSLSARSLMGPAKGDRVPLHERLHGKAPLVKWPKNNIRKTTLMAGPSADAIPGETQETARGEKKGENMSERFIAERLLSDRGGSTFNPHIPRRVLDIPSPGAAKSTEADMDGKRLVIGRAVTLSGEISGCERLIVEGKVDATLRDVKTLEVGAQGTFKGDATVETAVIAGTFEGKLSVSVHLDIGPGAVVKGTVSYGTIAVANGGKLLGTIESV